MARKSTTRAALAQAVGVVVNPPAAGPIPIPIPAPPAAAGLERAVEAALRRLGGRVLRPGRIAFRTGDGAGAAFALKTDSSGTTVDRDIAGAEPLLEIRGDPARIVAILSGRRDARALFLLGGLRVRGDMAYLSELGLALGFLDRPIV